MKPVIHAAFLLLVCASCAAESFDVNGIEGTGEVAADQEKGAVVHRFDIAGDTIAFHWLGHDDPEGDDWTIGIEQDIRWVDYLDALWTEYGPVTSLEVFYALAPPGMAPHPALVAAHDLEAAGMKRSGAGLALKAIDGRQLQIEKQIPADCQSTILPDISPGTWTQQQTRDVTFENKFAYTCAGSPLVTGVLPSVDRDINPRCKLLPANRMLTVGLCRDTSSSAGSIVEFWTRSNTEFTQGTSIPRANATEQSPIRKFTINPVFTGFNLGLGVFALNPKASGAKHRQITGVGVF